MLFWVDDAKALARTVHLVAISTIVEVATILIDGAMPKAVSTRFTEVTRDAFLKLDLRLIERPSIKQAYVGRNARSLGAALVPIHFRYFLTQPGGRCPLRLLNLNHFS